MKYELLSITDDGVKIYGRIDTDGKCRFTCTEDNPEYQAWLNPAEHFTPIVTPPVVEESAPEEEAPPVEEETI